MNIVLILSIVIIWLFSIFTFAKWRYRAKAHNGDISFSVLRDNITNSFVAGTTAILLVLVFYLI
jgi:heme/copper-type cytochrome/quinol oxidase subunit 2